MITKHKHKAITLKLAHINDTHSHFEPTSLQLTLSKPHSQNVRASKLDTPQLEPYVSAGGFARIATRVKQLRSEAKRQKKHFLFLHAGDCFQGSLYFSLFKEQVNADLLNALAIDVMTLGNHELDMGNGPVGNFCKQINFPLLAGNWDLTHELPNKQIQLNGLPNLISFEPQTQSANYIVKEFSGESVAIFGLSIDKMADIANPDTDTKFHPAIVTAKNTVEQIHQAGINKIILLSHLGYEADIDLAKQVQGIGLIVGGHSHYLQGDFSAIGLNIQTKITAADQYGIQVNKTYIVQSGCHALTMGNCEFYFDDQGQGKMIDGKNELLLGRRMFLDPALDQPFYPEDFEFACDHIDAQPNVVVCQKDHQLHQLLTKRYMPRVRGLQQQVITQVPHKMRHIRIPDHLGGSEIAAHVAHGFLHTLNKRNHHVNFAIHNAGGVRISLNPGPLTVADIVGQLLPFAVPIGSYDIQGKDIALVLEGAINNALNNGIQGTGSGSYPYTYNLRFEYDQTAEQGQRIYNLMIYLKDQWRKILDDQWYRGSSSAYTMKGKEGYDALQNTGGKREITQLSMADCFMELLTDKPHCLQHNINHDV